jgi:MFS family permease
MAMVFTTIGAVAGPNLVGPTGKFAESIGLPALTGPFLLAALAYGIAGLIIFIWLKPDPLLVAKQIESKAQVKAEEIVKRPIVFLGSIVMIMTQIIMVAIMTMTPIHMSHHGHSLSSVGFVIGLHIAAMYLPSLVTGALVDKFGRPVMIIAASLTLFLAGVVAAFSPADSLFGITIALVLLGFGWNFGLISGTALIIDGTTITTRAKVQGMTDVWIAIFGASAGLLSGIFMAMSTFETLSIVGGFIGFIILPALFFVTRKSNNLAQ